MTIRRFLCCRIDHRQNRRYGSFEVYYQSIYLSRSSFCSNLLPYIWMLFEFQWEVNNGLLRILLKGQIFAFDVYFTTQTSVLRSRDTPVYSPVQSDRLSLSWSKGYAKSEICHNHTRGFVGGGGGPSWSTWRRRALICQMGRRLFTNIFLPLLNYSLIFVHWPV